MNLGRPILLLFIVIITLNLGGILSCQNLNVEDLTGTVCDTSSVTYSEDIQAILQSRCLHCHYDNSPITPFSLQGYDNVFVRVESGQLDGALNHRQGYTQMPKDGPKLPECELSKINKWIREGAPNN